MKMAREDVLRVVIDALREAQVDLQGEVAEINENTLPIGELKYFDSLTSVMVTTHCLDSFGYTDPLDFPSLFIDKKGKVLTVGEVVDRILVILKN